MKFYIDFEATQFGGRIISIGCVSENGQTFNTLVKPSKPKEGITKFITELTGITSEMIATAPTADDAFNDFFKWVCTVNDNCPPQYLCYGDSDGTFIEKTVKAITNTTTGFLSNAIYPLEPLITNKEIKATNNFKIGFTYISFFA